MTESPEMRLATIAAMLQRGEALEPLTTRRLIGWFGAARRGRHVVALIRRSLKSAGLITKPDFEYAYIDEPLSLALVEAAPAPEPTATEPVQPPGPVFVGVGSDTDPTFRIGTLESANRAPISVNPSATVAQAITLMLYHDYSQLAVMQSERELKGAVSWRSIGRTLALQRTCVAVRDCIEEAAVLSADAPLFAAIPTIVEKEYVFVRDGAARISGIVTTTDLSLQFRQLAEPFLLLSEIENHLRRLSDGKFTPEQLASVKDPGDAARSVADLADLTFGEHLRLLEHPERWQALGLPVDRGQFVKHLSDVRDIRNSVMHFDPDGVDPDEVQQLQSFTRLLAALRE